MFRCYYFAIFKVPEYGDIVPPKHLGATQKIVL